MSHLLAHRNTSYVSEDAVIDISRVEGTDTWVPLHHADLITALEKSVVNAGMTIQNRRYSLSG
ncbi:MAG: hypothetical protein PVH36_13560, partial [Desulfobacterales bacterium]